MPIDSWQAVTHLAAALLVAVLSLVCGVVCIIFLRWLGKFPSELDRIGSDLNLYGYGIGLSLVFGFEAGRPVLKCLETNWIPLFLLLAFVTTLFLYGYNLRISHQIREINKRRYSRGLETFEHLNEVLRDPRGQTLFKWSICVGLFPTLALILIDLLGGG